MSEIRLKITNGYGIRHFDQIFTFNQSKKKPHSSTNIIYAQNGTMKSSLAKTIRDHASDSTPKIPIKDHIFGDPGECHITIDGNDLDAKSILSITSFDTSPFESSNFSSLVASAKIKADYDRLMDRYNEAWSLLILKIRAVARPSKIKKDNEILHEILSQYGETIPVNPQSLLNLLTNTSERSEIESAPEYIKDIPYTQLDTAQVATFIKDNAGIISKLVSIYDELRKSPTFYKEGFDASGARKIIDAAKKSKYFNAEHQLSLRNISTGESLPVSTQEELEEIFSNDIDKVLAKSPELRRPFEKLIDKFGAGNHGDLKRILEDPTTKDIVLIMDNARLFKRKVWQGYLKECLEEADNFAQVYSEIKEDLEKVAKRAKQEKTKWDEIALKFNDRFHNLPFTVHIENKDSVILEDEKTPEIVLRYQHPVQQELFVDFRKDKDTYKELNHLSTGERKAFYLLNILFEIEVRQSTASQHLIILDDIVDSFDYKNKYAFLEYISEVSSEYEHINLLLLTHNFDFFRLLENRLKPIDPGHFFIATKSPQGVTLSTADCFDIFNDIRKSAYQNKKIWLASILLARNLAQLKTIDQKAQGTPFMSFTKCLHSLDDEQDVISIQSLIVSELPDITSHPFNDQDKIIDILLNEARAIADDGVFNLYDNIILSMACRRMAEDYMKHKLNDAALVEKIKAKNTPFTRALYSVYASDHTRDTDENRTKIAQVNLITPEHMHLNAFAYEPLIDIDKSRLVRLHGDILSLYEDI